MSQDDVIEVDEGRRTRSATLVAAAFVSALVATAVVDLAWPAPEPKLHGAEQRRVDETRRKRRFADGSAARWVETELRLHSRVRREVAPWWTALLLDYGHVGSEEVLVGRGEWLFLRNRVTPPELPLARLVDPGVNLVAATSRRLAAAGCRLTVIPIPRKAVVCAAHLPRGYDPRPEVDRSVTEGLLARGVDTVDLLAAFEGLAPDDLYHVRDTHWATGAKLATVDALLAMHPEWVGDQHEVEVDIGPSWTSRGDLLHILGIPGPHAATRLVEAAPAPVVTLSPRSFHRQVETWTTPTDVEITGTSFLADHDLGRLLLARLRRDIRVTPYPGSEFCEALAVATALAPSGAPTLPRALMLEFPIHMVWNAREPEFPPHRFAHEALRNLPPPPTAAIPSNGASLLGAPRDPVAALRAHAHDRACLTSGEGLAMLRVVPRSADSARGTAWTFATQGSVTRFEWPDGKPELCLPLIEGAAPTGWFELRAESAAARQVEVDVSLVADLDFQHEVTLHRSADSPSRFLGRGVVAPRAGAVVARLAGPPEVRGDATLEIRASDGTTRRVALPVRGDSVLLVGVGGLGGRALVDVAIEAPCEVRHVTLARPLWSAE